MQTTPRRPLARFLGALAFAAGAALVVGACGDTGDGTAGGESHFLSQCEADGDCASGLECVCGVCTAFCDTSESCTLDEAEGICTPGRGYGDLNDACGLESQDSMICAQACTDDADCPGNGTFECQDGACHRLDRQPDDPGSGSAPGSGQERRTGAPLQRD